MGFKPSHVDVLIIGAGPAGSMLAASLARGGITTRIIDKRGAGVISGQADGLNCRTSEIFQALSMDRDIEYESYPAGGSAAWGPSESGGIERKSLIDFYTKASTEYTLSLLNQGRVEKLLQENAAKYSDIEVERGVLPIALKVNESLVDQEDAYPVEIMVQHLKDDEAAPQQVKAHVKDTDYVPGDGLYRSNIGPKNHSEELAAKVSDRKETQELIRARYVVGCDGAWSWTREQIGVKLEGAASDFIWGVIDIIPITDFPDAREVCMIQSTNGNILWIPREKGLIRLYTQLTEIKPDGDGSVDRSKITPDQIFADAQRILHPYKIDYRYCDWWTAYQVGQRVGEAYSDPSRRVFLAGDAVHTHSPKEGQGMNTSMQDGFNLAWKLAAVINKESPASILQSYQDERLPVADHLITVDRTISHAFSGGAPRDSVAKLYTVQLEFLTGFNVRYDDSSLVSKLGASGERNGHATNGDAGMNGRHETDREVKPNGTQNANGVKKVNGAEKTNVTEANSNPETEQTNGTAKDPDFKSKRPNDSTSSSDSKPEQSDSTVSAPSLKIKQAIAVPQSSDITTRTGYGHDLCLGARLPPAKVCSHAGRHRRTLLAATRFDGRWKLFVLPGSLDTPSKVARTKRIATALADPITGVLHKKHTIHKNRNVPFPHSLGTESGRRVQATEKVVPLVDVILVYAAAQLGDVELNDLDDVYWPLDEDLGRDYDRVFTSEEVYDKFEISREHGALLLVRPDQHLSWRGEVEDVKGMKAFLETCVIF